MNYRNFMKAVEERLASMSEEEKTSWIHNRMRQTKEAERRKTLASLDGKEMGQPIIYDQEKLEDWYSKIEKGEIYFKCIGYEVYGEDYWNREDEYQYEDPFAILDSLQALFSLTEDLLTEKRYKEVREINSSLLSMIFQVYDEGMDDFHEFDFDDLLVEIWPDFNFERVNLNLMYASYQTQKGRERVQSLYDCLRSTKAK